LLDEGIKDFSRTYKIENITQASFEAILPYIYGIQSNEANNFSVIAPYRGIPNKIAGKLRLRIKEILDTSKELTLTIKESEHLIDKGLLDSLVRKVNIQKTANTSFFPNSLPYDWNEDTFGPIVIPKAGASVNLNLKNLPLFKKIIKEYEENTLEVIDNQILINGIKANQYTFKQDYYWMMGDNRHRSEDSRFWGFVPENHVVGKPVLIWFSIEGINDGIRNWKIRWDRIMTTVKGEGKPISFFPYFLILVAIYQVYRFIASRKQN